MLYVAYNHRFEPHFVRMRDLIASGVLGRIYRCRMFYGNGTARLVRNSDWRDQGAGVLDDLGSHVLDTARFWFGDIGDAVLHCIGRLLREPQPRPCRVRSARRAPAAGIRNDAVELAQSFHLRRFRRERQRAYQLAVQMGAVRVHPSHAHSAERPAAGAIGDAGPGRSDLGARIRAFQNALREERQPTDLANDIWLNRALRAARQPKHGGNGARMMQARHRLCWDDASRPRFGERSGGPGFSHRLPSIPMPALIGRLKHGDLPVQRARSAGADRSAQRPT